MQAFTDLVGTSAVPVYSCDIEELTELTPTLDTAAVDHGYDVADLLRASMASVGIPIHCC